MPMFFGPGSRLTNLKRNSYFDKRRLQMARKIRKDITGPGLSKRLDGDSEARKIRKDITGPGLSKRIKGK
jgi:capsule polysaccharide export protein KpsC/LpsZ